MIPALTIAFHFMIPASDADIAFRTVQRVSDSQIIWPWLEGVMGKTPAIDCFCTVDEALRRLIHGTRFTFEGNGDSYTIVADPRYCWPELGPEAPLPPCTQFDPLHIHAHDISGETIHEEKPQPTQRHGTLSGE
jgi:hypothetical protein